MFLLDSWETPLTEQSGEGKIFNHLTAYNLKQLFDFSKLING
jgi:hypothetical protein